MKKIYFVLGCLAALLGAVSCEKENPVILPEDTDGVYILNNGSEGYNNSSLTFYDPVGNVVTQDVFLARNGKKLGDTAQDIIIYGNKMYITVYKSGVIFVTDKKGKIIREIKLDDYKQPRCLAASGGKVYATYFEGGLAQIDTVNYSIKTVQVGSNPEELQIANGKVYVANSGGMSFPVYGNTVSVVDIASFKVTGTLEVESNPCYMERDNNGYIYLISPGDYSAPVLQKIDPKTDLVTKLTLSYTNEKGEQVSVNPNFMALAGSNKMYLMATKYEGYNSITNFYIFNTLTDKVEGRFVTDTEVKKPYSIATSIYSGNVYIGSSDYLNNGDMYVFGSDGKLKNKFETGLNPIKVCFLTNK